MRVNEPYRGFTLDNPLAVTYEQSQLPLAGYNTWVLPYFDSFFPSFTFALPVGVFPDYRHVVTPYNGVGPNLVPEYVAPQQTSPPPASPPPPLSTITSPPVSPPPPTYPTATLPLPSSALPSPCPPWGSALQASLAWLKSEIDNLKKGMPDLSIPIKVQLTQMSPMDEMSAFDTIGYNYFDFVAIQAIHGGSYRVQLCQTDSSRVWLGIIPLAGGAVLASPDVEADLLVPGQWWGIGNYPPPNSNGIFRQAIDGPLCQTAWYALSGSTSDIVLVIEQRINKWG